MAKLERKPYRFPKFDPSVPYEQYRKREMAEWAKLDAAGKPGSIIGAVLSFPVGDGKANYIVKSEKPLVLQWISVGDNWQVEPPLIRGLTLSYVREMVRRQDRIADMLGGKE